VSLIPSFRRTVAILTIGLLVAIAFAALPQATADHRPKHGGGGTGGGTSPTTTTIVAPFSRAYHSTSCYPGSGVGVVPSQFCEATADATTDGSMSVHTESGPYCRPNQQGPGFPWSLPWYYASVRCEDSEDAMSRIVHDFTTVSSLAGREMRITIDHGASGWSTTDKGSATLELTVILETVNVACQCYKRAVLELAPPQEGWSPGTTTYSVPIPAENEGVQHSLWFYLDAASSVGSGVYVVTAPPNVTPSLEAGSTGEADAEMTITKIEFV
jgi:hypothetical protein